MNILTPKKGSIVTISAFMSKGDMIGLKQAFIDGLNQGLTINEIKEILVQLYAYVGFPRSLNGLSAFKALLEERQKEGITDTVGSTSAPLPTNLSALELGTKIQTKVVGKPVTGGIMDFSPTIDQFLKAHLFGDIFGRDILSYEDREIATLAALSTLQGADSQIKSHVRIAQNVGVSPTQLDGIGNILKSKIGENEFERFNRAVKVQ
ncbi:carboxymuconolactone decarboxylase family protein [Gilliamella sp. B3482]|uniref:carboxymuconolactone decarboxylase family protein n=1 Tax=Gilliamella sp. B3482 TaxID=2817991 RepID=UPI00226AAA0C|nr:carboxymuconolactone decarboxylase family protein [Gilliamella sp. B3482]MCX8581204.1 carboxymuconolactone decarboxylase family protein [Gilliamella sp. B3482]